MALLMSGTLWLVGQLPGEAIWEAAMGQAAYVAVLGGVITGGIVIASLVAFAAGEFSNSYILARMKVWTQGRYLWSRTIGSTLVGQLIDTVLFVLIATVLGVFPWSLAVTLIVSNYIFKVGVEVVFTPVTYRVVNFVKRQRACRLLRCGYGLQPISHLGLKWGSSSDKKSLQPLRSLHPDGYLRPSQAKKNRG